MRETTFEFHGIDGKRRKWTIEVSDYGYPTKTLATIHEGKKYIAAGYSKRNPKDENDPRVGEKLAVKRAIEAAAYLILSTPKGSRHMFFISERSVTSLKNAIYSAYRKAKRGNDIADDLRHLRDWFGFNRVKPRLEAIDDAKIILKKYSRRELPDWVEALANGNPSEVWLVYAVVEELMED